MPLLPASLAIPPGGEVPGRHTCSGAAVFRSLTMSGLPGCVQAPRPRPDGACLGPGEDGATLPFPGTSWWEPITAD
jgi:hypothetical protein